LDACGVWRDSDKHDDSDIIIVASLSSSSAFSTGGVDLQKKALNHLQALCFLPVRAAARQSLPHRMFACLRASTQIEF